MTWWQIWRVYPAEKGHTSETLGWIHRMGQDGPTPGMRVQLWAESFDGFTRLTATRGADDDRLSTAVGLAHKMWGNKIGFDTIIDTEFPDD